MTYGNTRPSYITLPETNIRHGQSTSLMVFTQGSDGENLNQRAVSFRVGNLLERLKDIENHQAEGGRILEDSSGCCIWVTQGDPFLWRFEPTHVMDVSFDSDIMMLQLD